MSYQEVLLLVAGAVALLLALALTVVRQGQVAVTTLFGRYHRTLAPGLHVRWPLVEAVARRLSLQHHSAELEFQAITADQANIQFRALILYRVADAEPTTVLRATFTFVDDDSFVQALVRSIEGSIRALVATRRQAEVLGLRDEIVHEVHRHLDDELLEWGYRLVNLQINDIAFDEAIMRSMAQVVATANLRAAAENEAQAQYISKTRVAEAEAHARRVVAEAERDAEEQRGLGNARMRAKVAEGLAKAGETMQAGGVEPGFMLYTMWLDTMKTVAERSHGNLLSFDGSVDAFDKTVRQLTALGRGDRTAEGAKHHR